MLHQMKLYEKPFRSIQNGTKTIELRLNDEKRQRVQEGDFIEFSLIGNPREKIQVRVTGLYPFPSFAELYAALPKEKLGYAPAETPDPRDMEQFYSCEAQAQSGVLGIGLRATALQRFADAQDFGCIGGETYQTALTEIQNGKKESHWMWYVFPQIKGLGRSDNTSYYAIQDLAEAIDFYAHPILGERLIAITSELLHIQTDDPMAVFGHIDAFKLRSCMTLFKYAAPDNPLFQQILDKFCRGTDDYRTLRKLQIHD